MELGISAPTGRSCPVSDPFTPWNFHWCSAFTSYLERVKAAPNSPPSSLRKPGSFPGIMGTSCRRQTELFVPAPGGTNGISSLSNPGIWAVRVLPAPGIVIPEELSSTGIDARPWIVHKLSALESKREALGSWRLRLFQGVVSMAFPLLCNCGIRPRGSGTSRNRNPWKGRGGSSGGFSLRIRF